MADRKSIQQAMVRSPLLTAAEVAALLQVSLRTVRRLIADGSLPVVRIGRSVRVSGEALNAFLSDQATR